MKKILIIMLMSIGLLQAVKYQVTNIKPGGSLNVRDFPVVNQSQVVGKLYANTINISIKECTELLDNSEWCYIYAQRGASYLEGWVNSYYLTEMSKTIKTSKAHIQNFLHNFYMADEEDYLDKLQVFYHFPMQQYLWKKNVSLMSLRSKKVREYKKWTKRDFRMTYLKILKRKSNYIDVQTTVRWHVENSEDYAKGKSIQKIRLVPAGNTFKIAALKNLKHITFPKPPEPTEDENSTQLAAVDNNITVPVSTGEVVPNKFYIKAGSFFAEINHEYLTKITKNGFSYMIQKVQQDDKIIRRVFIGPFDSVTDATQSLSLVREKINKLAYIQTNITK